MTIKVYQFAINYGKTNKMGIKMKWDKTRAVGEEVSKWYVEAIENRFMDKYLSGEKLLDIGSVGYLDGTTTFHENAESIDTNTPGYDLIHIPRESCSIDGILASHILEHIPTENVLEVLRDWYRVLKIDSHMVITVPSEYRYEKRLISPENGVKSRYNEDHKRGYTPAKLLAEIEAALEPNSYFVELCRDHYKGWDRNTTPEIHSGGQYEVLVVIKKTEKPDWRLE
jgi:SAM-dependent methyltransferase